MESTRTPIIGIFGHIDHGKSTLVDYLRKSNITAGEAGGITQHVGAYEILYKARDGREHKLTLLDTPGHEAFGGIRKRGASAADVAVLVVSAEDGVKPQTLEALKLIQESETPFIVAINKVDKPSADIEKTKQNLAENNVYVEGYGGSVSVVPLSAKTGQGVDDLMDMILLTSELEPLKVDREALGEGIIIESRLDHKKGNIGVGVLKGGTVRKGLFASSAGTIAPIRIILDVEDNIVEELSASSPIQITGWESLPQVGDVFKTFLKKDDALAFAESRRNSEVVGTPVERVKTDAIPSTEGQSVLPLMIKVDSLGSLEAITGEIAKLGRERIVPRVIYSGAGTMTEGDLKHILGTADTAVFTFHTKVDARARAMAERSGVEIYSYDIIYELIDKVKKLLEEREPRIEVEEVTGKAKVLKIFSTAKNKQVLGGRVLEGEILLGASVKIIRRDAEIGTGKIKELQQARLAVEKAGAETEFGALVESKFEVTPGDILQSVRMVTK